jgi:hypothetical protein
VTQVSRHGVRLSEVATAAGALVAFTGSGPMLAARSQLVITGAMAVALVEGTWVARELNRRRGRPPSHAAVAAARRTPWHVLPAGLLLGRLGTTEGGLSSTEAARRVPAGSVPRTVPPCRRTGAGSSAPSSRSWPLR